jgi:hypothetical protein
VNTQEYLMNRIICAITLTFSLGALAQGAPQQAKDLQRLVGNWKGSAKFTLPDGNKVPVTMSYECKSTSAGFGLSCRLAGTMPDGSKVESTDIWGYSAGDGLVHWFTVTSAGETHDHKMTVDGNVLVGQFEGPQDGKLYVESVRLELLGEKKLSFRSSVTLGGKPQESFEGVLSR